ncbi:MAG TPA: hypothetical protein VFS97_01200 [Nitrososphaeraceae archaeon]|nr:hypothetical protein [Nitrososphaeraceae archaeon]
MKNNSNNDVPVSSEEEIKYMKERLTRCLQLLKLNHDDKITKIAFDLIEKSGTYGLRSRNGNWIIPLNAIAGSCLLNQRVISQSEMYDFLTVAVTTSLEKRTKAVDELIFRIYKDIMASYEGLDDKLKIAYPKIIVDVVSILASGVDTSGKKTPVHNVEIYYQTRKSDVISITPVSPSSTPATTATATSIQTIEREPKIQDDSTDKDKDEAIEPKLIAVLATITGRSKKDIEASLVKLDRRDFMRITDLYKNYNKLQKYSKMVIDRADLQEFKVALEKDTGRKLSNHQIQHAASSIRKVKLYIENVLDGKFVPRGSYGINHTKHNLEYGYLVVGLMERSRKSRERIPKKKET